MTTPPPRDRRPPGGLSGDLACWIHAAFPRRRSDGRLDTALAAAALGVSTTTLRRWARSTTLATGRLTAEQRRSLHRRANLRGKGRYLWPAIDAAARQREQRAATEARTALRLIADRPDEAARIWGPRRWLEDHELVVTRVDAARVWQVFATRSADLTSYYDYLARQGGQYASVTVPNRQAATLAALAVLGEVDAYRCVVPGELIRGSRSYCWRLDSPVVAAETLAHLARTAR